MWPMLEGSAGSAQRADEDAQRSEEEEIRKSVVVAQRKNRFSCGSALAWLISGQRWIGSSTGSDRCTIRDREPVRSAGHSSAPHRQLAQKCYSRNTASDRSVRMSDIPSWTSSTSGSITATAQFPARAPSPRPPTTVLPKQKRRGSRSVIRGQRCTQVDLVQQQRIKLHWSLCCRQSSDGLSLIERFRIRSPGRLRTRYGRRHRKHVAVRVVRDYS